MQYHLETFIQESKTIKIRRNNLTEKHKELSKERILELVNLCGGRMELCYLINYQMRKQGYFNEQVDAQSITNCLYRKRITPQLAFRIEKGLSQKEGFEKFTKEYLCPDLVEYQFDRVKRSMFIDKTKK